jgi:uncharacterized membrane protein
MNGAHWHLVVNHFPIIFPIVGLIVMITGLFSKSESVKRTAFMIFIIGSFSAVAAMITGERAEEVVENINGVTKNFIESHEEKAETFAIFSYILGVISLLGLWASLKKKSYSSVISIITLIFAFVVLFFAQQTGTTGGEIRHTEIRSGNSKLSIDKYEEEDEDD